MNAVVSSLYTAAMTMCLFSVGVLGREHETNRRGPSWLTWFLVIEAASFACELLMAHPSSPLKGLWLGLRLGGSLLIAPCLWLAVREIVTGISPSWRDLGRRHLIAIAVGAACTLPLIADAHLGVTYMHPQRPTSWLHARFIHTTMLACIGIFAVQAPIFLRRCRSLLLQPSVGVASPAWLRWLLPIVAATWALGLLRTVQCAAHAPQEFTLLFSLLEVSMVVAAIYLLIRRASRPIPEAVVVSESEPEAVAQVEAPEEAKYARSRLTSVIRDRIKRKLDRVLRAEDHCTDSELSLRTLSAELKENPHYVSQVINQDLGVTFYDLVNLHRIERAKRLLREAPEQTVLEIALAVGFNSKSTFNTAFRRHAGMTPTDFRQGAGK